jgi:flavin-dependent dehydrogenase
VARTVDVLVLGAGPAGATIARLAARRGYSVLLLKGPVSRQTAVEVLPKTADPLLELLGIHHEIEQAGFYPQSGRTTWWDDADARIAPSAGYCVERRRFDQLLLCLAEREDLFVERNSRAPRVALSIGAVEHDTGVSSARFVVDATGRAGLLARQIKRMWDPRRTIAICGLVRGGSPEGITPHEILIEAYDRGWASAVPLSEDLRLLSFVVDAFSPPRIETELDRTFHLREFFRDARFEGRAFTRDAGLYYAGQSAGLNWILVGDAGCAVDPLSPIGLEKALRSAWLGAEVIDTCLSRPADAEAAIARFNEQELGVYHRAGRANAGRYAKAASVFRTPFWNERGRWPDAGPEDAS